MVAKGRSWALRELAERVVADYRRHFDSYEFSKGLESVGTLIARLNKYIVENEPWKIANDASQAGRLSSVLFHCTEALRRCAAMLAPPGRGSRYSSFRLYLPASTPAKNVAAIATLLVLAIGNS